MTAAEHSPGRAKRRDIRGAKAFESFCAMPVEMTSEDKTKKGNMEGISIVRHMKSPSEAAFDISGANRISPMPNKVIRK